MVFSLEILEEKGQSEEVVVAEIRDFLTKNFKGKPHYMCHNAIFDLGFMKNLFARHKYNSDNFIHYHGIDTMQISLFLKECGLYEHYSVSLVNCYTECFKEEMHGAHTSHGDVLACEKLYTHYLKMISKLSFINKYS